MNMPIRSDERKRPHPFTIPGQKQGKLRVSRRFRSQTGENTGQKSDCGKSLALKAAPNGGASPGLPVSRIDSAGKKRTAPGEDAVPDCSGAFQCSSKPLKCPGFRCVQLDQ